jgi:hypothetical protein
VSERAIVVNQLLDGGLEAIVELEAFARKEFYSVVLKRIVRGRNHYTRIGAHTAGEKRDTGSWQRADQPHIDAHRTDSRRDRGLEHVAGEPGVLADEYLAMAAAGGAEHVRECAPELERGFRGDRLFVGDSADAVGTEKFRRYAHRLLAAARDKV